MLEIWLFQLRLDVELRLWKLLALICLYFNMVTIESVDSLVFYVYFSLLGQRQTIYIIFYLYILHMS